MGYYNGDQRKFWEGISGYPHNQIEALNAFQALEWRFNIDPSNVPFVRIIDYSRRDTDVQVAVGYKKRCPVAYAYYMRCDYAAYSNYADNPLVNKPIEAVDTSIILGTISATEWLSGAKQRSFPLPPPICYKLPFHLQSTLHLNRNEIEAGLSRIEVHHMGEPLYYLIALGNDDELASINFPVIGTIAFTKLKELTNEQLKEITDNFDIVNVTVNIRARLRLIPGRLQSYLSLVYPTVLPSYIYDY